MMKFLLFLIVFNTHSVDAFNHNHMSFSKVLKKHITIIKKQSYFNYLALKKDTSTFDKYLKTLSKVKIKEYDNFTNKQKLSFLINAYNAFTIKIIIDHYPVKSIKDIGSFFTNTWKKKFFTLLEEKTNLDHIEHGIIRKKFNEPRIHFAVNCASIGCPSLQDTAFTEKNIDFLLEKSTINFLSNTSKNKINLSKKTITISKIFKWYGKDFIKKFGSVEQFIAKYLSKNIKIINLISNKRYLINYSTYDWNLNKK